MTTFITYFITWLLAIFCINLWTLSVWGKYDEVFCEYRVKWANVPIWWLFIREVALLPFTMFKGAVEGIRRRIHDIEEWRSR